MTPELLAAGGVFVAAGLATGWFADLWLRSQSTSARRLRAIADRPAPSILPLTDSGLSDDGIDPALRALRRLMPPQSARAQSRLQRRLLQAGYNRPRARLYFDLAELVLVVIPVIGVLLAFGLARWPIALVAGAVGYALPTIFLDHRIARYQKAIRNGLPDALDLLTLCVEAGTALDQAIAKTSKELDVVHPELAYEFRIMTTEIRAGRPRLDAFRNLADRANVDDVRTLVSMMSQTDRFGTSIGQALRTHAEVSRLKRRQRAEERAGRVSVLLVFPLVLCLFPTLYVVVFGSAMLKLLRGFGLWGLQ